MEKMNLVVISAGVLNILLALALKPGYFGFFLVGLGTVMIMGTFLSMQRDKYFLMINRYDEAMKVKEEFITFLKQRLESSD